MIYIKCIYMKEFICAYVFKIQEYSLKRNRNKGVDLVGF